VQTKEHGVHATMKKDEFGFLLMNLKKSTFTIRATICLAMANKASVFFFQNSLMNLPNLVGRLYYQKTQGHSEWFGRMQRLKEGTTL
jgi:hypothetical protein